MRVIKEKTTTSTFLLALPASCVLTAKWIPVHVHHDNCMTHLLWLLQCFASGLHWSIRPVLFYYLRNLCCVLHWSSSRLYSCKHVSQGSSVYDVTGHQLIDKDNVIHSKVSAKIGGQIFALTQVRIQSNVA